MGSLRAEHRTFTTQTCSSHFFFSPPTAAAEMCLLCEISQSCCCGPSRLFWVLLNRKIILLLQTAQREPSASWRKRAAGTDGRGKKNISIGRVEIITRCNGNPINSTISCSEVLWNYSPHLFKNVFPYGSNRPAGCLHISSMTVQMLSVLSRKETASLHPL